VTTAERAELRQQLLSHEGLRLRVYTDSLGIPTIGCGRNLRDRGITAAEAMDLLDHDIDECLNDCLTFAWFTNLDPVRQRAVLDLRFNLGATKLRTFTKFLGALNAYDYATAAEELRDSRWAHQVQPARVKRITDQIRLGAG
jgi:lysozyme